MNMSKKICGILAIAVCLAMILGTFGCVGASTSPAGDKITILPYGEPDQLDPATCYDMRGSTIIWNIYDRLVRYEGSDVTEVKPAVAKRWGISDDGLKYTFYLRDDVKFHNGDKLTAEDVKYSFNRVIKMNQPPSWMFKQCMDENSMEVLDGYTVKITLTKPYAAFMHILTYTVASVVNKRVVEENGGVVADTENLWMNENECGSGPFELKLWTHAEQITLTRFDDYWGESAKLREIYMPFEPEVSTRIMLLKKGDADIALHFPATNVKSVEGAKGLTIERDPTMNIDFIVLACRKSLADKNVRQALAYSMDYEANLKYIYYGYARRAIGVIPEGIFGNYDVEEPYELDLEKANAILDRAGYDKWDEEHKYRIDPGTGEALTAEMCLPEGEETNREIALGWQANLKKIGFDLVLRKVTWARIYDIIRANETEMIISGWLPDYPDPDNYADSMLGSANTRAIWGSDYHNEEIDRLIDKGKWETDETARKEIYKQIEIINHEDAPFIWTAQTDEITVMQDYVKGYCYNSCQLVFYPIYMEK